MNNISESSLAIIKSIFWDYNVDPEVLYKVLNGEVECYFHLTKDRILIRMLERLNWYDILNVVGFDYMKENLTKEIIANLRFKALKEKYEFVRKILQGEPVPSDGWDIEYRKKVQSTLLSHRWYRTIPALLQP